jgi:hypothetical protein
MSEVIRMTKPSGNAGDTILKIKLKNNKRKEKKRKRKKVRSRDTIILPEIQYGRSLKLTPFRPGRPVKLIKSRS